MQKQTEQKFEPEQKCEPTENVSHKNIENHTIFASQVKGENQNAPASQNRRENQNAPASQHRHENQKYVASQAFLENHEMTASQSVYGTQRFTALEDIVFDEDLYPCEQTNWHRIHQYKKAMDAGNKFPPILLGKLKRGKTLYLVDGKHRFEATLQRKETGIESTVKTYNSKLEMRKDAIRLNRQGLDLSWNDTALNYKYLKSHGVLDSEISTLLGVPTADFALFANVFITKDGKEVKIPAAYRKSLNEQRINEVDLAKTYVPEQCKRIISSSTTNAVEQVVTMMKDGILNNIDDKTEYLLQELYNLLRKRFEGEAA